MFLVGHATEHGQHTRMMSCKTESPRSHAIFRTALLETSYQMVCHLRKTTTQQWFHDVHRNISLGQLIVKIFGMIVARCMTPIHIIKLNHGKIPFHIHRQDIIKNLYISVERPTEVSNSACFAFLQEEIQQAIVDEAFLKGINALATTNGMEKIIVNVIHLKVLHGVSIHLYRALEVRYTRIRHLGSNEILVTRMTTEGNAHDLFRLALQIYRSRIEEIHTMLNGIIHQFVYLFLVDDILSILIFLHRPAHTSVSEKGNLVASIRIDTVGHFTRRFSTCTFHRPFLLGLVIRSTTSHRST